MPFAEMVGKEGTTPPAQMFNELPKLNVGVMLGSTVTVNVAVVAHNPEVGVKVYTPDAWLSATEGLHVPVIPLSDVRGSDGTVPPSQMVSDVPKLNTGVLFGFTVTVSVVTVAHVPGAGVNV